MDNHSGDSSSADGDHPPSAAAAPTSFGDDSSPPPLVPAAVSGRAKFMVSYGGRILPKPHDNQLSYVGGETKILAVDRSARFSSVLARLASMCGVEDLCVKYQLPGEDLDALISVTNDEDLEHMMLEYDRLQLFNSSASQRSSGGPPSKPVTARLRLFLFPIGPPPPLPSAALLEAAAAAVPAKPDPRWFVDALNAIPAPPSSAQLEAAQAKAVPPGPDFLFGFDEGFIPPPSVKVKDCAPEASPVAGESFPVETAPPPVKPEHLEERVSESVAVVSAAEIQRQVQDFQKLQIAENHLHQQQQSQAIPRNASDEALTRVYPPPPEYYAPRTQEKPLPTPSAAYWPDPHAVAPPGARFASIASNGDHPVYLIHAPAPYPGSSPAGQAYYAALPRMVPASQLYAMSPAPPPPSSSPPPPPKVIGHQFPEGAATGAAAYATAAQMAYNNAGHAVYYAGAVPTYQTVSGMVLANPTDAVKTSAPAVKPSQAS